MAAEAAGRVLKKGGCGWQGGMITGKGRKEKEIEHEEEVGERDGERAGGGKGRGEGGWVGGGNGEGAGCWKADERGRTREV